MRALAIILGDVVRLLSRPGVDTGWSRFATPEEARSHIGELQQRAERGDDSVRSEVELLFLPTGALQEIAMASGWHDEYMQLADEIDAMFEGS